MNREKAVSGLQIAMYMLNLAAVCLVAGIMSFSLKAIVRSMDALSFLEMIQARPWRPETILLTAVCAYLFLVFLSTLLQQREERPGALRTWLLAGETAACVAATAAMGMNYDGLVLLVVADLIRGQKGSRQKLILGIAVVALYTVLNYNLAGRWLGMVSWDAFLSCYQSSAQIWLRGLRSLITSVNLAMFILYMTILIQGEYRERARIQLLYEQLESANEQLRNYAMEAERNAETRERNRLAREIHDTLGHALTGIVAGIDACITMLDYSPEATRSQLEKVGTVARQGITDVRRSVSKLRPDALEKLPLEEALRTMLENMASASGVNISFENQVRPLKFHEDEEEAVYRMIQEASTNAIRHGHAARISICIAKKDQWLTVQVKDNGCGCENVEKGFGLKHMEERLKLLGGKLSWDGSRTGFVIRAEIPIRWGEGYSS